MLQNANVFEDVKLHLEQNVSFAVKCIILPQKRIIK